MLTKAANTILALTMFGMWVLSVWNFNTADAHYCHAINPHPTGGWCDIFRIKCTASLTNCENNWQGWVANNRLKLANAWVPKDFSILDVAWWCLLIGVMSIWDTFLYAVYFIRMPLVWNPMVWTIGIGLLLSLFAPRREKPQSTPVRFKPVHGDLGREPALGDGDEASEAVISATLRGGLDQENIVFED